MHRRIKKAIVNFNDKGEPVQVEATYFDEVIEGSRTFSEQKNETESFDQLPQEDQRITIAWISDVADEMIERRDPFDGSIPAHLQVSEKPAAEEPAAEKAEE